MVLLPSLEAGYDEDESAVTVEVTNETSPLEVCVAEGKDIVVA